jgi:hypothetical protein
MMDDKLRGLEVLQKRFLKQKPPTPKGEKIQDNDEIHVEKEDFPIIYPNFWLKIGLLPFRAWGLLF